MKRAFFLCMCVAMLIAGGVIAACASAPTDDAIRPMPRPTVTCVIVKGIPMCVVLP